MNPALHAIAQFSALRIVDTLAEGTVIALFAACCCACLAARVQARALPSGFRL